MNIFMGTLALLFCLASIGSDVEHEQRTFAQAFYVVMITMVSYNLIRMIL